MRTGLVAAGANIAVVSLFAVLYGIFSNSPQIMGLGLSGILAGLGLIGAGSSPPEGPSVALGEIISLLLNALTSITEEFDLTNSSLMVVGGNDAKIVVSPKETPSSINPGVGVTGGTPYLAIPLGHILEEISPLNNIDEVSLRNTLSDIVITHLNVGKLVDTTLLAPGVLRVSIAGLRDEISELEGKYPISPLTILLLAILYRLTGKGLRVKETGRIVDGAYWILEMEE